MKNIVKWSKNRRNKQTRNKKRKREKRELIKPEKLLSFVIYNINNRFDLSVSVRFKSGCLARNKLEKKALKYQGDIGRKKNKNVFQKSINCIYLHWVYLKRFMIWFIKSMQTNFYGLI